MLVIVGLLIYKEYYMFADDSRLCIGPALDPRLQVD